jgi:hypothetical protein
MPSVSVVCHYCKVDIVSHHYMKHLLAKHKEVLIEANITKFHSETYDSKPITLDISPSSSLPYYCCLGCKSATKAEGSVKKHFDNADCKRGHLEFLLDVRHKYPKTGPKPSALALNPDVIRNIQKFAWELLEEINEHDKDYKYDWYTKAFRNKIPVALDKATLTKLFKTEEEEVVEEKKEVVKEEVDEEEKDFLVVPAEDKPLSRQQAFDRLEPELREMMTKGGFRP